MPRGYTKVGTQKTGRRGRPKTLLERADGQLFVWRRARGGWRPRIPGGRSPQLTWRPGWIGSRGDRRGRLALIWRTRRCDTCAKVRYTWSQYVWQSSRPNVAGRMIVRSFPVKERDIKHPNVVHRDKAPKVGCHCPGKNGVPRRTVVDRLALSLQHRLGDGSFPLGRDTLGLAAVW